MEVHNFNYESEKYYARYCNNDWINFSSKLDSSFRSIEWLTEKLISLTIWYEIGPKNIIISIADERYALRGFLKVENEFSMLIYFLYSIFLSLTSEVIVLDFGRVRNQISSFKDRFLLRFLYSFESMNIRYKEIRRKCAWIRSNDRSRRRWFQRWINSIYRENSLSTILQLDPTAFGQRLLTVPWVQRGIQQPGCIYYFTGTRVLYGSGWSGLVKRQHDTGRVVDATTTSGRGMHRWRASAAFYMPPRLTARLLHRFHGRYGYTGRVWVDVGPPNDKSTALGICGCRAAAGNVLHGTDIPAWRRNAW